MSLAILLDQGSSRSRNLASTKSELNVGKHLLSHLMVELLDFAQRWFLVLVFFAFGSSWTSWSALASGLCGRDAFFYPFSLLMMSTLTLSQSWFCFWLIDWWNQRTRAWLIISIGFSYHHYELAASTNKMLCLSTNYNVYIFLHFRGVDHELLSIFYEMILLLSLVENYLSILKIQAL